MHDISPKPTCKIFVVFVVFVVKIPAVD